MVCIASHVVGKQNWVMCAVGSRIGKGKAVEVAPEISVRVHRFGPNIISP